MYIDKRIRAASFLHIIPVTLISLTIATTTAYGDIGSKYTEKHKSVINKKMNQYQARPFHAQNIIEQVDDFHIGAVEEHLGAHVDQAKLELLSNYEAYVEAFEEGDELFEIDYNALDGAGVNVGNGKRFSTMPRLDLDGPTSWANVLPHRITGPNGTSCIGCHNQPVADGAGGINDNVIRIDPERRQKGFIERQSPHVFGMGAVQLLAEEMTTELHALRDTAITQSCISGKSEYVALSAKNIDFGQIRVSCENVDYRNLRGIDNDLIVKPFEWKGLTAFVRDFIRGASHQELGMQATELVGNADSDFDGVSNELTVGDITALTIYNAAQPRPTTKLELNSIATNLNEDELTQYGLPLTPSEIQSIESGEQAFAKAQCTSCHTPALTVSSPVYSEPSTHSEYRDDVFPAGYNVSLPSAAITFDITSEILDNNITLASGQTLGQFERSANGDAIIRLYGDLMRHNIGKNLAEEIDEGNLGSSVFLTENLWGVGSTAPYLHDGRATTLTEAILSHGGEARNSRKRFNGLTDMEKSDLLVFLDNLVLYLAP